MYRAEAIIRCYEKGGRGRNFGKHGGYQVLFPCAHSKGKRCRVLRLSIANVEGGEGRSGSRGTGTIETLIPLSFKAQTRSRRRRRITKERERES